MQILSFCFFTALVGCITFLLTQHDDHESSEGYFLAGRRLTGGVIAGSLLLTNLSTEQLVGLNGAAFRDGLSVLAWEVIAGASLVLMALYFLPRYLRRGIATVPQFLEERFDSGTRTITTLIFIIAYAGILLPIVLYTGARGLSSMLDIQALTGLKTDNQVIWLMVWIVGVIGSMYAIFGGLRTVAVSDTINGCGLLVGGVLIMYFGLKSIGGDSVAAGWQELQHSHPEKFNSLGAKDQSVPFSTLFTGVLLLNLFYWTTNQQIIQRTFVARDLAEGQKGVLIAGMFKVLAPIILVLPGIIAFHKFGILEHQGQKLSVAQVTDQVTAFGHDKEGKYFTLSGGDLREALAIADDAEPAPSIGDSLTHNEQTFIVSRILDPGQVILEDPAGQAVVVEPEDTSQLVGFANKDAAYGKLVRTVLPGWLSGFFAAVMVGAILSSFNSGLNSTATLYSLGVYKTMIQPDASQEQIIRSGKLCGAFVALLAMTTAPLLAGQDSIFGYLQKMNGLYFIPIFSVVLVGMLSRRVPGIAAKIALLAGFTTIALGYFVFPKLVDSLHEFHFLGIVFVSLVGLMLIIGQIVPRSEPYIPEESGDLEMTPWKWRWVCGLGILVFVIFIYVWFADPSVL